MLSIYVYVRERHFTIQITALSAYNRLTCVCVCVRVKKEISHVSCLTVINKTMPVLSYFCVRDTFIIYYYIVT